MTNPRLAPPAHAAIFKISEAIDRPMTKRPDYDRVIADVEALVEQHKRQKTLLVQIKVQGLLHSPQCATVAGAECNCVVRGLMAITDEVLKECK